MEKQPLGKNPTASVNGLQASVRQVFSGRLNGDFSIQEPPLDTKITIAYDIAGNAIECSLEDIIEKKLRPTPDFNINPATEAEKATIAEPKTTRSGKSYDA
tara:strand:- start:2470 stop:2772 length:303 start_codon:yes stop_codon:yes gene_type:complete